MKKVLFPATNRVHLARQQLLLNELAKDFDVIVDEYEPSYNYRLNNVSEIANHFRGVIEKEKFDLALIRGDRLEQLPIAMICAYSGIKIAHLEGGDTSGAVDQKVRWAITALSDIHFATNKESYKRLINFGTDPDHTHNFGSLDVEFAKSVVPTTKLRVPYVLICHHPLPGENPELIEKVVREEWKGKVIVIKSNKDSGVQYGAEEYSPSEYIKLIANAKCLVGNSSSFLKEASIFGTPVVNIGSRQENRLKPHNVKDVPFDERKIRDMLKFQLNQTYTPSMIYYQEKTSKNIAAMIKNYLDDKI